MVINVRDVDVRSFLINVRDVINHLCVLAVTFHAITLLVLVRSSYSFSHLPFCVGCIVAYLGRTLVLRSPDITATGCVWKLTRWNGCAP